MFRKKGKRKIIVNGKTYYWCVKVDKDTDIEPIHLHVFTEDKYLCGQNFYHGKIRTIFYDKAEYPHIINTTIFEEPPEITPSIVHACILEHLNEK
jgi:hypothetical protein